MIEFDARRAALEDRLGYQFRQPHLLREALTHPTWVNEHRRDAALGERPNDYERLEFLGDAVLSLVVSRQLLLQFPTEREGSLSRRRAQLVRKEALADLARGFALQADIYLGQGQKDAGVADSILADVLEAIMGAAFLDGGLTAIEQIFGPRLTGTLTSVGHDGARRDDKTELQELCHRLKLPQPHYTVISSQGPSHDRVFRVRVEFPGAHDVAPVEAEGRSKKAAEQRCAHQAYAALAR